MVMQVYNVELTGILHSCLVSEARLAGLCDQSLHFADITATSLSVTLQNGTPAISGFVGER